MPAYYNEFDAQKAAWLRELMRDGQIAPGDVDERSIRDVRPDDLRGYTQCHFFAGVAIWSYALRLAGWPDGREVWSGSCPCQPFSAAGKGEAFDDARHLWPEFFRLIEARRPLVCFGEQVSSIDGLAWFDAVRNNLDDTDYTVGCLDTCAAGVGAPHRRQRLYWVADTADARCDDAREHGGGRALLSARSEQRGADGIVADTAILGHDGRRAGEAQRWPGEPERLRDAGGLENANGLHAEQPKGQRAGTGGQGSGRARSEHPGSGEARSVEDSLRTEWRENQRPCNGYRQAPGRDESTDRAGERSEVERMAVTERNGWGAGRRINSGDERAIPHPNGGDGCTLGPVNGFWRSADWVLTRPQRVGDRPGLRPVERGAFPLAHGTAARVGRLRGYGDGIVAQQAAAFVRAYMEVSSTLPRIGGDCATAQFVE